VIVQVLAKIYDVEIFFGLLESSYYFLQYFENLVLCTCLSKDNKFQYDSGSARAWQSIQEIEYLLLSRSNHALTHRETRENSEEGGGE